MLSGRYLSDPTYLAKNPHPRSLKHYSEPAPKGDWNVGRGAAIGCREGDRVRRRTSARGSRVSGHGVGHFQPIAILVGNAEAVEISGLNGLMRNGTGVAGAGCSFVSEDVGDLDDADRIENVVRNSGFRVMVMRDGLHNGRRPTPDAEEVGANFSVSDSRELAFGGV